MISFEFWFFDWVFLYQQQVDSIQFWNVSFNARNWIWNGALAGPQRNDFKFQMHMFSNPNINGLLISKCVQIWSKIDEVDPDDRGFDHLNKWSQL